MLLDQTVIRSFIKEDFEAVQHIYAEGLATGIATFETKIPSWTVWDEKYIKSCRLVAEQEGELLGFAVLSQMSKRDVYKGVAEVSLYIAANSRRKGIGTLLLNHLIHESESHGFWTLLAQIFAENTASIKLHEHCGFRMVGVREKLGQRNGKWYDNCLLERRSKLII